MPTSLADTPDRRFTLVAPGLWAMVMVHAGALLAFLPAARPTSGVIVLAIGLFVVRTFCISAGYHRYFSHSAFKTSRWLQFVLAFVGGMGVMRGALWWAAHHRQHHRYSDEAGDPHSPVEGFLWSHMGWFIARGNQNTREELIKDWEKYPELVWLNRHEWVPVLALIGFTYWVGILQVGRGRIPLQFVQHRLQVAADLVAVLVRVDLEITELAALAAEGNVHVEAEALVGVGRTPEALVHRRDVFLLPVGKGRVVRDEVVAHGRLRATIVFLAVACHGSRSYPMKLVSVGTRPTGSIPAAG